MKDMSLTELQSAVALMAQTQGRIMSRLQGLETALQGKADRAPCGSAKCRPSTSPPTPAERATVAQAARAVERLTGVSATLIRSPSRTKRVVRARWLAMKIAHDCGLSIAGIGRALAMDHTTVMHGLRQIAAEQAGAKHDDQA